MRRTGWPIEILELTAAISLLIAGPARAHSAPADGQLLVTAGKSIVIDSPLPVEKIAIANGDLAEAIAIRPTEILINGKTPGETSVIVWQRDGARLVYDLAVRANSMRLDAIRQQIARDFPGGDIGITLDNETVFVRGTVKTLFDAERVMAIAATVGRAINLLRVEVPAAEPQILLKVRFADVDRSASSELGMNLASTAFNQTTGISTGQFGTAGIGGVGSGPGAFSLSDALNILLFRKDINLGVTIQALENKNLLQMLAEPNVLAINGKPASFIDGGEIPVPVIQSSANPGALTVAYKQYGIKLNFLPVVTPSGTIRLEVAPEVSSLDFANAVTVAGTTVPAISTRRVETEVELEDGQSFVIAGLIDRTTRETFSKIPGLASLPVLGKLFQSRSLQKSNSELLVIVTPELVRPIPKGQQPPELTYPAPWLKTESQVPHRTPGIGSTGPVPPPPPATVPVEQLLNRGPSLRPPAPAAEPAVPRPPEPVVPRPPVPPPPARSAAAISHDASNSPGGVK